LGIRSARLVVCGAVAVPVLAAGLAWAPAAHAAGPGVPLPAAPAISPARTVPSADAVTGTVEHVRTVADSTARALGETVRETPTVKRVTRVLPSTDDKRPPATTKLAPRDVQRSAARDSKPDPHHGAPGTAAHPRWRPSAVAARSGPTRAETIVPAPQRQPVSSPGGNPPSVPNSSPMGAGVGSTPLLLAFLAASLALAIPGLGRRMLPSLAEGLAYALTLDLERPD